MPRCNSCNKWASLEQVEPEVSNLQLSNETGHVEGTVTIENNCAECNETLRRAEFDLEGQLDLAHDHPSTEEGFDEDIVWDVHAELERTERRHPPKGKIQTTYYGYEGQVWGECSCGFETERIDVSDEIKASHMEEA